MFWKRFRSWLREEYGPPVRKIPKIVYLIRHPHTNDEVDGIYRGEYAEVTEKGREESIIVAGRIAELGIECIVTSTYARSIHLTNVLRDRCQVGRTELIPLIPSELFVECRKPSFTVLRARNDPKSVRVMSRIRRWFDWYYRHSDEESRWHLEGRAHKALRLLSELECDRVAVVTHGKFMRVLWHYIYENGSLEGFYKKADRRLEHDNTGVTTIILKGGHRSSGLQWNQKSWNDCGHTDAFMSHDVLKALASKP